MPIDLEKVSAVLDESYAEHRLLAERFLRSFIDKGHTSLNHLSDVAIAQYGEISAATNVEGYLSHQHERAFDYYVRWGRQYGVLIADMISLNPTTIPKESIEQAMSLGVVLELPSTTRKQGGIDSWISSWAPFRRS